jgi:integrase
MARKQQRNGGGVIEYATKGGDTVYRIQYRDASGRQIKETLGRASEGWDRTKAKDERKKRVGHAANGYVRPDALKFDDYADQWWIKRQVFKSDYSPRTIRNYKRELVVLKEQFGARKLGDLTTTGVNAWTAERLRAGVNPRTVNRTLTVLGMILDLAIEEGVLDPFKRPKPHRPAEPDFKPKPPTAAQSRAIEAKLAKNPDPQVRLAFLSFELLGWRMAELQNAKWENLDFEDKRLRIERSKTKKGERSLHVPSVLLAELREHRGRTPYNTPGDYIFHHPERGSKWRPDRPGGYYEAFHAACSELGIEGKLRPGHELRAAFITDALKNGVSPAIVMTMVGHESFTTTKRYADLAGVTFEDEAEALAERRMGKLRALEGGETEGSFVQEAHN